MTKYNDPLKMLEQIMFPERNKMPDCVRQMSCPKCKHKYLLPTEIYNLGFKRCPKCQYKEN